MGLCVQRESSLKKYISLQKKKKKNNSNSAEGDRAHAKSVDFKWHTLQRWCGAGLSRSDYGFWRMIGSKIRVTTTRRKMRRVRVRARRGAAGGESAARCELTRPNIMRHTRRSRSRAMSPLYFFKRLLLEPILTLTWRRTHAMRSPLCWLNVHNNRVFADDAYK